MLTFSFLTLFPELLAPFAQEAIVGKARERGLLDVRLVNLRDHAGNKHFKVDDTPYGGGAGMVELSIVAEEIAAHEANFRYDPELAQQLAREKLLPFAGNRRASSRIIAACRELIPADGVAHPAEYRALAEIKALLGFDDNGTAGAARSVAAILNSGAALPDGWVEVTTMPCRTAREVEVVLRSSGWTGQFRRCPRCS